MSSARQLLLDVLLSPEPSLDNYVVGSNHEALAAVGQLRPGQALYLWGPQGSGKSHLLKACLAAWAGEHHALGAQVPVTAFDAVDTGLVTVDDVHLLDDARQAALFALINRWRSRQAVDSRSAQGLSLLVAGNCAPAMLPLREDLRTRLAWGLVCRLDLLSDADKRAALLQHARERQLALSPDIVDHLLLHHTRDLRQLVPLIDALDHYSLETRRPVTLPLLRALQTQT